MIHRVSWRREPIRNLVVALVLSSLAGGCGGSTKVDKTKGMTKPRVAAAGKVQYDGKDLEVGTISFTSKDTGNAASSPITKGTFTCKAEEGPNPGENAVLIAGKETADGPNVWIFTTKVDVPEGGLTDGSFTVDAKATKKAGKGNPDD